MKYLRFRILDTSLTVQKSVQTREVISCFIITWNPEFFYGVFSEISSGFDVHTVLNAERRFGVKTAYFIFSSIHICFFYYYYHYSFFSAVNIWYFQKVFFTTFYLRHFVLNQVLPCKQVCIPTKIFLHQIYFIIGTCWSEKIDAIFSNFRGDGRTYMIVGRSSTCLIMRSCLLTQPTGQELIIIFGERDFNCMMISSMEKTTDFIIFG